LVGGAGGRSVVAPKATCDPAEVARVEQEMATNPLNMGVGVINTRTGQVRLYPFDDTTAFALSNPHLSVQDGHEAAAAMAGIPKDDARGFALVKQGNDWHVFNQSHLNRVDGQSNTMRMNPQTFNDIVSALQTAGVQNPVIH
jgi:hypothetical protein